MVDRHMTATATPQATDLPSPRRGTRVVFDAARVVPLTAAEAWRRLVDWPGHGRWVPLTRIDVNPGDPDRFVAWSGIGPLQLEDRMHALEQRYADGHGFCRVAKLGPVLVGEATFTVSPGIEPGTTLVQWHEDVSVPRLPGFLAGIVGFMSGRLFELSLARMARRG